MDNARLTNGKSYFFDETTDEIIDAARTVYTYNLVATLDQKVDASNCPNGIADIKMQPGMLGDINYHNYLTG